ncbi:UNKNOWN [Stylonychia lemnae]|uniref:Uncharacterized protein n=1 Tax=Stylonychia lemnae TaxID=5949 RepID=A0A077ZVX8_STYLE|nr:UNKNOWN [Stylonychia lemnae]|eukprot:CDW74029.1 UNKNOWN [Stylonychia lemnae]
MLVMIVQNLQEHKDIIEKLCNPGMNGYYGMDGYNDFYYQPEDLAIDENGITAIQASQSDREGHNLLEKVDEFYDNLPSRENNEGRRQSFRDDLLGDINSRGPMKVLEDLSSREIVQHLDGHQNPNGILEPGHSHQENRAHRTNENGQIIFKPNLGNQRRLQPPNVLQMRPRVPHINFNQHPGLKANDVTLNLNTPQDGVTNSKQNPSQIANQQDLMRKIEFMDNRLQQHESLIQQLRNQVKADPIKEKQLEDDQEMLNNVLDSPQKSNSGASERKTNEGDDKDQTQEQHHPNQQLPLMKGSDDQQSTIQMLQNLLMRTRKDIQDKFDTQLRNQEQRVMSQVEALQNWLQQSHMMGDEGYEEEGNNTKLQNQNSGFDNSQENVVQSLNTSQAQIDPNISYNDQKVTILNQSTQNATKNTTSGTILPGQTNLQVPRGQNVAQTSQFRLRVPPKQLNDIKDLQKKAEKFDAQIYELFERHNINDKIVGRINDYYETNLKVVSVRGLGEQIKEFEKQLENKANILDVKKLVSSIRIFYLFLSVLDECNDKFNWLEERYKEERKDQEMINQNNQLAMKNMSQRAGNFYEKVHQIDRELAEVQLAMKKSDSNNWMNGIGGPSGISSQSDQIEELQNAMNRKFSEYAAKFKTFEEELQTQIYSVKDILKQKLSQSQLLESEERTQGLMDKIIANINKRFMDRKETKKTLKQFEQQLEHLLELVVHKVDEFEVNEAMLAKKPLGGWSCASCQKNIQNLSGHLADYQVTHKLPGRESGEHLRASHKLPQGLQKLVQNYGISNKTSINNPFQNNINIDIKDNAAENQSFKGKNRYKGMLINLMTSPNGSLSPERIDLVNKDEKLLKSELSSIHQHQSQPVNYLLKPKLKTVKHHMQHSLSQKRFGDTLEIYKDLQIDNVSKQSQLRDQQHLGQIYSPSSLPALNNKNL